MIKKICEIISDVEDKFFYYFILGFEAFGLILLLLICLPILLPFIITGFIIEKFEGKNK